MQQILDALKRALKSRRPGEKQIVLLLGGEASFEPGRSGVDDFIVQTLRNFGQDPAQLDRQLILEAFYDILNDCSASERDAIISSLMGRISPSEGHYLLADLVRRGFFNLILSTDFTDQIEASFSESQLQEDLDYSIFWLAEEPGSFLDFLRSSGPAKVLKLRGDWTRGIFLPRLSAEAREALRRITDSPLLVVGCGRHDQDVLEALNRESENRVWWVSLRHLDWGIEADRCVLRLLMSRRSDRNVLRGENAGFDHFFRTLYQCLTSGELPEKTLVGTWDHLLMLARKQASRYLGYVQDTTGGQKYIPSVYCRRQHAEAMLEGFMGTDKAGLVLVGDSGVGKTNLLCHFAERLLEDGNVTLMYNCAGSLPLNIEAEIRRDLSISGDVSLLVALERVSQKAHAEKKQCVILFDAVNEFRFGNANRAADLLKNIDNLIGRCCFGNMKFVLSCRTSTWNHLELFGQTELNWDAYYFSGDNRTVTLERFSTEEFDLAYPLYQAAFGLNSELSTLSEPMKEKCRDPLLLRMTAEVYKDRDEQIAQDLPTVAVFKEYYERKVRKPPAPDEMFLEGLVVEMEKSETDRLPVLYLQRPEILGRYISEDLDCAYHRLKDVGVLMEIPGDYYMGDLVRFTYDRVFEYALARHFLREQMVTGQLIADLITDLVLRSTAFPSLWGAARIMLTLEDEESVILELANSQHYECRELIADMLVSMYGDAPGKALGIVARILREPNDDAKRIALKAAYSIGSGARGILVEGASEKSEATRKTVSDYLYLLLKRDPEYGSLIWDELVARISIRAVRRSRSILQTLVDIMAKTFIDQSNSHEAIQRVSETAHSLTVEKLPVVASADSTIGRIGQQLLVPVARKMIREYVVKTLFFSEYASPEGFFDSPEHRMRAERGMSHLLHGESSVEDMLPPILEMLESSILFNHGVAIVVLATECAKTPQRMIPIMRRIFEELSGAARLWILIQFCCFSLLEVPDGYLEMLEEFAERFVREDRETFIADPWGIHRTGYIPFLGLGLAYCRRGYTSFPTLTKIIQEAVKEGDVELTDRCIWGLAPIGFYFPNSTLNALESIDLTSMAECIPVVANVLATIRTLFPDEVDAFLLRTGASDSLAKEIRLRMDPDLVRRYTDWIGLYSTAVYSLAKRPYFGSWLVSIYLHAPRCNSVDEMAELVTQDLFELLADNDYYIHRALR